ncbi:extracellular solute-binding protein [Mesorhizobium sp.]|uniref:extracellular solute-binding protein n=1 Tax=Mesorhizobium sp. TaxID=1871066 RepID=UPI00120302EA|nr:extracellular solute-binding protein [Mesorhizobium sp.]TIM10592.1 MAG: extracellular solute-binding protein [Mesorhizobium sp.]
MRQGIASLLHALFGACRAVSIVLLLAAATLTAIGSPALAERVALVIGNGAYRNTPALSNPPKDAEAIAEKLRELDFVVTVALDAKLVAMRSALKTFTAQARSAEVAVIFYAGHGLQVNGENYLIPVDANLASRSDLQAATLRASEIYASLVAAGPDLAVLVLDACRDNPFSAAISTSPGLASGSVSASAFVQRPNSAGMLIGFAAAPGAVAFDGGDGHSPFTTALLQWIDRPGLELGTMLRRVRSTVVELTHGAQVPWVEEALLREVYLYPADPAALAGSKKVASIEVALLDTIRALELPVERTVAREFYSRLTGTDGADPLPASLPGEGDKADLHDDFVRQGLIWLSIRHASDIDLFQKYLDAFPSGPFAAAAEKRIEKLREEKEHPPVEVSAAVAPDPGTLVVGETTGLEQGKSAGEVAAASVDPLPDPKPTVSQEAASAAKQPQPLEIEAKLGLGSEALAGVQALLTEAGEYSGRKDANFGPGTRKAIESLQRSAGLDATGYLDQRTLQVLVRRYAGAVLRDDLDTKRRDAVHLLAAVASKGAGARPTVLRVAAMSRNDAVHAYWRDLSLDFEARHPGYRVTIEHQPGSTYKATLLGMLGSDTPPDIMHTWGGGHLEALREAGFARDLTEEMSKGWALEFRSGALQTYTQDGRIYGVPSSVELVSLWVNTSILEKAGVAPEHLATWGGFLEAVHKLKAQGVVPIAIGGRDRWPFQFLWGNLAEQIGGRAAFEAAYSGAGEGFLSPSFVEAGQRLRELAELQPFQVDFLSADEGAAGMTFAKGGAAMVVTGNWRLNTMRWNWPGGATRMSRELRRLDFPAVSKPSDKLLTYGGADGYAVNSKAPEMAVELLRVLTSRAVQSRISELADSVPSVSGSDLLLKDPFVSDVAATLLRSSYHQLYYDQALGPIAGEVLNEATMKLATGDMQGLDAARAIDRAWDQAVLSRAPVPTVPTDGHVPK